MRLTIAMLAGVILLAGCESESDDFQVREDDGSMTTTVEAEDGTATMKTGESVPVDLPAGFLIYPGAKILSNTVVEQETEKGAIVMMESDAPPQEMVNFYRDKAAAAGIEITMDIATDTGKIIGGEREDGLTFSFSAQRSEDETLGQLTIGKTSRGSAS